MKHVLILCTGNSCRSILGEALLNHFGKGRVKGYSAGSHPTGEVNPNALAVLQANRISAEGLASKSWDALEGRPIDLVITVCDEAAGEICPAYLGKKPRAHWGLPDPAKAGGSEEIIQAAFTAAFNVLKQRVERMLALPLEEMSDTEWVEALDEIGRLPA